MDEIIKPSTKYNVYLNSASETLDKKPKQVGCAYHAEGDRYYTLRLWMFPKTRYYIAKNLNSDTHFKVFSKCVRDRAVPTALRFQDPMGDAILDPVTKAELRITLDLCPFAVYMSTIPSKK